MNSHDIYHLPPSTFIDNKIYLILHVFNHFLEFPNILLKTTLRTTLLHFYVRAPSNISIQTSPNNEHLPHESNVPGELSRNT